ncbi:Concanavalin A-like lectin/glucanase [Metarhizium brunneum]
MRQALTLTLAAVTGVFAAPAATTGPSGKTPIHNKRADFYWGGAVQEGPPGTGWNYVQGSVVVPSFGGGDNQHSANMWVGIDGDDCTSAILQTGLVAYGDGTFWLWTEWWKHPMQSYETSLAFSPNDTLRFTVHATSTTSGTTTVENLSSGHAVSHTFTSESAYPLCETDAEWILEDWQYDGQPVALENWGTIKIFDTVAKSPGKQVTAAGSGIVNININGQTLTSSSVDSDGTVSVTYIGPN